MPELPPPERRQEVERLCRLVTRHGYAEYLTTEHWQRTRREALARSGYRCAICGDRSSLQVHHLSYERLGWERPDDLEVLCEQHHRESHPEHLPLKERIALTRVEDPDIPF